MLHRRLSRSHLFTGLILRSIGVSGSVLQDSVLSFINNKLNQEGIDQVINNNAVCEILESCRVSHFYSNQVGVNRPVEDRWNVGCLNLSDFKTNYSTTPLGHFFSVVDGHNGHACSHTVNYCHMDYISVLLINNVDILKEFLQSLNENEFMTLTRSLASKNTWGTMATSVRESHFKSLRKFINETISNFDENIHKELAIRQGLCRLDKDMILAAAPKDDFVNRALLRTVSSGCVGTFVYIPEDESKAYIAQVGDCGSVLGSFNAMSNLWTAELLIPPHNSSNTSEIERIESEHPINESQSVIRHDRLLGELMPLRAFGNIRFKWPLEQLQTTASLLNVSPSYSVSPQFYLSPPYLTSEPEMRVIDIDQGCQQFLIIASDGLWDLITPSEAVRTIGTWRQSRENLNMTFTGQYCDGINAASLLIKTALGGSNMDYEKLSNLLSMPANVGRYYRDDITVIVVFFQK